MRDDPDVDRLMLRIIDLEDENAVWRRRYQSVRDQLDDALEEIDHLRTDRV